ncbi:MAG: hypothetical protein J5477_06815 [Schwartzia sp.]|nr:hypothetical protein [Schwartzia sp. (in: firmicutes)]
MEELIERIEELTADNTALKAANAELEKQNKELLELEEEGGKLKADLSAQKELNAALKRKLDAMASEYADRLRELDALAQSAASLDIQAIDHLSGKIQNIEEAAERVKTHVQRYFYIYVFLVSCMLGIGGVGLWKVTKIAKVANDVLYLLLPK